MSEAFNVNTPLEIPPEEYSADYIRRLINQLRLNFVQIDSPDNIREVSQAFDWYIS
jgi:hypothetical protein|tara:strand:- start:1041 stop:1208 length:168 start_codon:yes stop_codon:yes gene_type:complete